METNSFLAPVNKNFLLPKASRTNRTVVRIVAPPGGRSDQAARVPVAGTALVPVLLAVATAAVVAGPGAAPVAAVVSVRCSRRHVASAAMRLKCRSSREVIARFTAAIASSRFVRLAKLSDFQTTSTLRRRGCLSSLDG